MLPIMTELAPAAIAFVMSPEYLMPPSAMTDTSNRSATSAHSAMADTWGTPTPATTRVVQIEPGPMPTFTASAPALMRSRVASPLATFPAIIERSGYRLRISSTVCSTARAWP